MEQPTHLRMRPRASNQGDRDSGPTYEMGRKCQRWSSGARRNCAVFGKEHGCALSRVKKFRHCEAVKKSELLLAIQNEIQRRNLSTFMSQKDKVVLTGCSTCRKHFGTVEQFKFTSPKTCCHLCWIDYQLKRSQVGPGVNYIILVAQVAQLRVDFEWCRFVCDANSTS